MLVFGHLYAGITALLPPCLNGRVYVKWSDFARMRWGKNELGVSGQILDHPLPIGDAAPVQRPAEDKRREILYNFVCFRGLEQRVVTGLYWFAPVVPDFLLSA